MPSLTEVARVAGLVVLSYLLGGIPTGYLAVRWLRGIDIREHGSGNPGTANVYRIAGVVPGVITLVVDGLKGFVPVMLAQRFFPHQAVVMMLCGAAAIIGHDWTVFLGFKGGKGVATSAGVFAAMMPKPLAAAVAAFIVGYAASGHISVGSIAAAAALPVFNLVFQTPLPFTAMAAAAAALILFKHLPNIKRLLAGKELFLHEKKY
ncbi:MAG: glycerol-3-phosphate 1-O-acyltransferase PlsY [Elusimicrobia bacterium]|nr:glycerol-3-phosphate 1-O-acyltransferase PlsY [Elusimicrobiota bacterium]